jgi:trimeric autotransporter adhesin
MALHVCVRGIGIRRSKDLRAEIGKCPNSTNERKNMSTKTLRKRIALVAVASMGFGVLTSVAPANAAQADASLTSGASVGVLASSITSDLVSTATMLSTGSLSVTVAKSTAGTPVPVKVAVSAGGAITSGTNATIAANQASATNAPDEEADLIVVITPTGAVGSTFTVDTFVDASTTTVSDRITVTIAGSSVAGVVSVANSSVAFQTADGDNSTTDVSGKNTTTAGNGLFLNIQLNDAYKADITSTTGALVATATAGATVAFSSGAGAVSTGGTFTQAVSSASPADINLLVKEATAGAGWSGTVTVTYNGVVIATKSGTITGAPAKITLTAKKVGKTGTSNASAIDYQVTDAAGNNVVLTATTLVFSSSSNTAVVSTGVGDTDNTTSAVGKAAFTCTSTAGTADLVLQTTLSNGTVIKSNAVTVLCGGAAATYTASFDKAAYAQGDIATLTVSFKDSKGLAANSYDAVSADPANQVITVNQTERVTAHAAAAKLNDKGNLVYTFTVGTSSGAIAGKYQALVSMPTVSTGSTQTVGYEITGVAGAVSNADVLKAIVSLIASINKQIAALQKALLRR